MSEVKRYYVNLDHGTRYFPVDGCDQAMNKAEDFDRVTAERDAALAQEVALARDDANWKRKACESADREAALQALLTAADERADVLESALRELLAGTGNSPGANRKYGRARAVLAGSPKQSTPEPCQGIPGTSFQRLNALANQGE